MTIGQESVDPDDPMPEGLIAPSEPIERPLSAYTSDELFSELQVRFTAFTFRGEIVRYDDEAILEFRYHGRMTAVIGLATEMLWHLQQSQNQ